MNSYADLHLHVSLTHYVNELGDIWYHKEYNPRRDDPDITKAGEFTQSDVHSLISGKVNLSVVALYAIEGIIDKDWLSKVIAKWYFGFRRKKVKKLRRAFNTNFKLLEYERDFILKGPLSQGNNRYMVVQNRADLIQGSANKLVFSIEGAHNLHGSSQPGTLQFEQEILENLRLVKQWVQPVFMLTLCHFQYNYVAGQAWAIPLPDIGKRLLQEQVDLLSRPGNEGITNLGFKVITRALDKTRGKRILIDLKHSSVETRQAYYQFIRANGLKGEVPVIISHAGVSGINTFQDQISKVRNEEKDAADDFQEFNPWALNICDDDIRSFVDIGGMIGISMDQRILGDNNKAFRKSIKSILQQAGLPQNSKNVHCCLWLENIFHIILIAQNPSAWNMVCMSSDFGGIIDPLDSCPTTKHLIEFENRLKEIAFAYYVNSIYLNNIFISVEQDLNDKIRRILSDNLQTFVFNHFPV